MRRTLLGFALLTASGCFDWDDAVKNCTRENGCLEASGGGPSGVSAAPTAVAATPGVRAAHVRWEPPTDNGGSTLIRYSVTASPGQRMITVNAPATELEFDGLADATSYTFVVAATNGVGESAPSEPSSPIRTFGVASAPTLAVATPGNAEAQVEWTAPSETGGSPITGYRITAAPGSAEAMVPVATQATVSGLTNGVSYTFTVVALNAVGASAPSTPSNAVTPTAVPGPPTLVVATAGNGQADVQWVPAAAALDAGVGPTTSYRVTSLPDGLSATTSGTGATVTGLTNGTSYTFTVRATNAQGEGLPSAPSNAVTPTGVPGVPTSVNATAGNAEAAITWTAPVDTGGSAITGYTVTSSPGGVMATSTTTQATVLGLSNGTSYTFVVKATNLVGEGLPSAPSNAVTPATVPSAPGAVSAIAANAQATVQWALSTDSGGSPITGYRVTSAPGLLVTTVGPTVTQTTVSGLANGTSYTFTVEALNAVGASAASTSNAAVPRTVPDAPTGVSASRGNGQATVQWTPPGSNGGSPITGYTVVSTPGSLMTTAAAGATQVTVTGLTNGLSYTFAVTATNAAGSSPAATTNAATPATLPSAPTAVTASRGNAQATVQWTAPSSDGGSAITGYTVVASPGGASATTTGVTQVTVTGLSNGTAYTFSVRATNSVGPGPLSSPSTAVTPATVPAAPTAVTAVSGDTQATVQWAAPVDDGGSPITGFTVTSSPGKLTASGAAGSTVTTVAGLSNGTAYTFTVTATNALGNSGASVSSNAVTPGTIPGAPRTVRALAESQAATVSWLSPLNAGGTAITAYTVTSAPGGLTAVTSGGTRARVTGLTNGTAYTFTVRATNSSGPGPASAPSNVATPAAACPASVLFTAVSLDAGTNPSAVTGGDFNADGKFDLAVANYGSNTVSVIQAAGGGVFPPAMNFSVGTQPFSITSGDLNGDGLLDLAAANNGSGVNTVSVLLGGLTGFQPATSYSTGAGTRPGSIVAVDLNADGRSDLATANTTGHNISVLLASGSGFQAFVNYPTAATGAPRCVTSGDLNGDGRPDLVVTNTATNNVSVLLGTGSGTVNAALHYGAGSSPYGVALGELNATAGVDLAVANSVASNNVGVLPGDGTGAFPTLASYQAGSTPRSVVVGDFNGDGRLDLAASNFGSNEVSVMLASGSGAFLTAVNYPVGVNPLALAAGDFNDDGKLDLAVPNSGGNTVTLLLNTGCN